MFNWIKKIFTTKPKKEWGYKLRERDPSKPINFGHKWVWVAVKTEDTKSLLDILDLKKMGKTNWVEGSIKAHKGFVFVLP